MGFTSRRRALRNRVGETSLVAAVAVFGLGLDADVHASDAGLASAPPPGTYIRVDPPADSLAAPRDPMRAGPPLLLYMNRCIGGITINPGIDNSATNTSSIAEVSMTFPPYPHGDAAWNNLVAGVQDIFAPFNVVVTDVDPGATPHDEALVCGADSDFTGLGDAGGVAPFTCARIPNAITYVFPDTIGNDHSFTVHAVAQEAAHAWGLDHSYKCEDPMTYLSGCGDKSFQDGDFPCGEFEARACSCGGATQNTVQYILAQFGPGEADAQPPTAVITSPQDGQAFAAGHANFPLTFNIADDRGVASVKLFTDGIEAAADGFEPFEGWEINDAPAGEHDFYIVVADDAGNETVSEAVTVHVMPDNGPGGENPGGSGADTGPGGDGSDGGDGPSPDDDDNAANDDDDGNDESDSDEGLGGIPVGPYPTARGDANGCACDLPGQGTRGAEWMFLLLALGFVRRRRA